MTGTMQTDDWLPQVYEELRKLASAKLSRETPGQTLDATALVHEAYMRLNGEQAFENKGHFFAAAAEAMRRILVERARVKGRRRKLSEELQRTAFDGVAGADADDDLLALDEALTQFAAVDDKAARLVKLRYFAGFSVEEAGETLGLSRAAAYREWTYAKAWLRNRLGEEPEAS